MSWLETIRSGLEAVTAHRMRSTLTVLGILIGIAAVILTVGLGQGATAQVNSTISSLGTNLLIVTPGSTTSSTGVRGGFGSSSTLTYSDAVSLSSKLDCPDISGVAPTAQRSETVNTTTSNWTTTVVGSTPSWLSVRGRNIDQGSFFTQQQLNTEANVAVLGQTTAQELGLFGNAVGSMVDINGIPFTVQGILTSAGSSANTNEDDTVIVPITTAEAEITGSSSVQTIYLQASSSQTLGAAYQEATSELYALHDITSPANADFTITSQSSLLSTATSVDRTLTILLGGIAAISLLVGGIGVMNIMLVSVTERIKEIGLRKALGATPAAIRGQFLVEASVLGLTGGVLGVALGTLGAVVIPHFISNKISLSAPASIGAVLVAITIGVTFGVYPATRAAHLTPIEALRND